MKTSILYSNKRQPVNRPLPDNSNCGHAGCPQLSELTVKTIRIRESCEQKAKDVPNTNIVNTLCTAFHKYLT